MCYKIVNICRFAIPRKRKKKLQRVPTRSLSSSYNFSDALHMRSIISLVGYGYKVRVKFSLGVRVRVMIKVRVDVGPGLGLVTD